MGAIEPQDIRLQLGKGRLRITGNGEEVLHTFEAVHGAYLVKVAEPRDVPYGVTLSLARKGAVSVTDAKLALDDGSEAHRHALDLPNGKYRVSIYDAIFEFRPTLPDALGAITGLFALLMLLGIPLTVAIAWGVMGIFPLTLLLVLLIVALVGTVALAIVWRHPAVRRANDSLGLDMDQMPDFLVHIEPLAS